MRTIVDILQRGNLELFHSSMLAWLLGAKGEHGLEGRVLEHLSGVLSQRKWPQLERALEEGTGTVETEVKRGNHRYDIYLKLPDACFVFENKTKTVGNTPQLELQRESMSGDGAVVALGLCEESFLDTVPKEFPMVTYSDVLAGIEAAIAKRVQTGAFGVLVEQYASYLKRELEMIDLVRSLTLCPREIDPQHIARRVRGPMYGESDSLYTENDRRFWNLILLEQSRRTLSGEPMWENTEWMMDKNMRSGVWLAGIPPDFAFSGPIRQCKEDHSAYLWFHVELFADALVDPHSDRVGMLQLRSSVQSRANKEFGEQFQKTCELGDGSFPAARIKRDANSFYVVGRFLQGSDLLGDGIPRALSEFAGMFQ